MTKKEYKNLIIIVIVVSLIISSAVGFFAGIMRSVNLEELVKVLE